MNEPHHNQTCKNCGTVFAVIRATVPLGVPPMLAVSLAHFVESAALFLERASLCPACRGRTNATRKRKHSPTHSHEIKRLPYKD